MEITYNSVKLQTVFDTLEKGERKIVALRRVEKADNFCWYKPHTWFPSFETKYSVGPAEWKGRKIEQEGIVFDTKEEARWAKNNYNDIVNGEDSDG